MKKHTGPYLLILSLLVSLVATQITSCGQSTENEMEETLQAIYHTYTAEALVAPQVTQPPDQAPAEASPTETPPPTPPPQLIQPGEPGEPDRTLEDVNSSVRAEENRGIGGDKFLDSLYERPFTSEEMIYQPDLDIITVDFAPGDNFFYFTIRLFGKNPDVWGLNGVYGVEFDRTLTGRGDLIVLAEDIGEEWSANVVTVYADENGDVGGPQPLIADAGFKGNGYDTQVIMSGEKAAFARVDPEDAEALQFAVSRMLLDDPEEFLWNAWADNGLKDTARFDYNDTMGPSAAGSPMIDHEDYPVQDIYNLDNTCRLPYGFDQMGANYRGMCISRPSAPEPSEPGVFCYCAQWCFTNADCCEWACISQ